MQQPAMNLIKRKLPNHDEGGETMLMLNKDLFHRKFDCIIVTISSDRVQKRAQPSLELFSALRNLPHFYPVNLPQKK